MLTLDRVDGALEERLQVRVTPLTLTLLSLAADRRAHSSGRLPPIAQSAAPSKLEVGGVPSLQVEPYAAPRIGRRKSSGITDQKGFVSIVYF